MKSIVSSIRTHIRAFAAPQHELSIPRSLWRRLVNDLADRGEGVRESGAFLLGSKTSSGTREAKDYLLYDDLEPGCLDAGFVKMTSVGFRALGREASARSLEVVADIHTHPEHAFFSGTDRDHPMVPVKGHLALVVPDYALKGTDPERCAMFRFLGGNDWEDLETKGRHSKVYVGFWS